jgi:hypothetical protein
MGFIFTFVTIGVMGLLIAATILRGWALSILWGWFVVPVFGLPPLSIPQAIGIAVTFSLIAHQYVPSKDKETWGPIVFAILSPFIAVLVGYIVRSWL